jgi:hypothetical protein
MSDELGTLLSLLTDRWFLAGLGIAAVVIAIGLGSKSGHAWSAALALLIGVGGATYFAGRFEPLALVAAAGLALVTAFLARPVISEASTGVISYVIADSAWRPNVDWPVITSAAVATVILWRPNRFARADQRVMAIVVGGAAAAIWASVPDTEGPRALLGSALAVCAAALLGERPFLTGPAVGAFTGLAVWAMLYGGGPRAVSVFGGWCGLMLLSLVGVEAFDRTKTWAWFTAELVLVAAGSQVIAVAGSGLAATGMSAVALAVAWVILMIGTSRPTHADFSPMPGD